MAKRFFYVATGVFLLLAAYQLGVRRAEAQGSAAADLDDVVKELREIRAEIIAVRGAIEEGR